MPDVFDELLAEDAAEAAAQHARDVALERELFVGSDSSESSSSTTPRPKSLPKGLKFRGFTIVVQPPNRGPRFMINVSGNDKVEAVKAKNYAKQTCSDSHGRQGNGIPVYKQRLKVAGRVLEDDNRTFKDYNINSRHILRLELGDGP